METLINKLIIEGKPYVLLPQEILEREAPHLLEQASHKPYIPNSDGVPLEVLDRHLSDEVSMARAWREYLGFTQAEIAKRMGITQAAYQQSENASRPRKKTKEAIAKALGIRLSQLD